MERVDLGSQFCEFSLGCFNICGDGHRECAGEPSGLMLWIGQEESRRTELTNRLIVVRAKDGRKAPWIQTTQNQVRVRHSQRTLDKTERRSRQCGVKMTTKKEKEVLLSEEACQEWPKNQHRSDNRQAQGMLLRSSARRGTTRTGSSRLILHLPRL